jgi:hypothetical protein
MSMALEDVRLECDLGELALPVISYAPRPFAVQQTSGDIAVSLICKGLDRQRHGFIYG